MFPTISRIRNALRSRTQAEPAAARALPGVVSFDVFISHSTRDKTIADAVCAALENAAIRCWIAPRDVVPGSDWGASIVEAIDRCRAMMLIFSSSANNPPQIRNELVQAVNRGAPIIPIRIENVLPTKSISYFVSGLHWLDSMSPPLEQHLNQLVETIHVLLKITTANRESSAITPAVTPAKSNDSSPPTPQTADEYRRRGNACMNRGDYNGAIAAYSEALKLDSKDVLGLIGRSRAFCSLSEHDDALRDIEKAIEIDGKQPIAFASRGDIFLGKGENERAFADYDEALRLDRNCVHALRSRGYAHFIFADRQRAIADFSEIIRLNPEDVDALKMRGDCNYMLHEYDPALKDYSAARRIHPRDTELAYHSGTARMAMRDFEGAISDFDEAVRHDPRHTNALKMRAVSRRKLGDSRGAEADENAAKAIDPNIEL